MESSQETDRKNGTKVMNRDLSILSKKFENWNFERRYLALQSVGSPLFKKQLTEVSLHRTTE